jgi:hypothetical protein
LHLLCVAALSLAK